MEGRLLWCRSGRHSARGSPTGYGLAWRIRACGIEMTVCAPGRTERRPEDRVKTDQRDAVRLARLLAAGELTLVTVPSVEREWLRDLVRCHEGIRSDLMRARHRLGKFLLPREIYYEGPGEPWSLAHRQWLTVLRFSDRASQLTIVDYLHAHDVLLARRDRIESGLAVLAAQSPFAQTIGRLRCLRGIDTFTAHGLCAELGEFDRFDPPRPARRLHRDRPLRAHQRPTLPGYCWQIATHPDTIPPASLPAGDLLTHPTPIPQKPQRVSRSL